MPIVGKFLSTGKKKKINNAEIVEVLATDQIKIGDVIYAVKNDPILKTEPHTILDNNVDIAAFSPDGKTLILGGYFTGYAKVYSVDGTNITYISDIYADNNGTVLDTGVDAATFSPDGKTLVLGGDFTGFAKVYSVNGTNITYISDIYGDNNSAVLDGYVYTAAFSPDGKTLILGGYFTGYAKVYSVDGTNITYIRDIYADNNGTVLSNYAQVAAFSPDGKTLILGGAFSGRAKIYSVDGTNINYISNIYADDGVTRLSSDVITAAFSPDGKTLILGGRFAGKAKVYSVDGTNITYISDIYADNNGTVLDDRVFITTFFRDGKAFIIGGWFTGRAKVYSIEGTNITYIRDIYANAGTSVLNNYVYTATFSPDGKTLILGGAFRGKAKAYLTNNTSIIYIKDIYADGGTITLDYLVNTAVFSPDGKTLILGGDFTGIAKIYSVDGTNITYVNNIYRDDSTTNVLNRSADTVVFSPDGKTLILGGYPYAKVYSVDGTNITYISDINVDSRVNTAVFSPDGKTLILGGNFSGFAKVYSVNGTNITYISDINVDSHVNTAVFSPDGKTLILGGGFTGKAKVYSVDGTNITYISDIYANAGTGVLNSRVYTATFSPDGKTLILGGDFTGSAKVYSVDGTNITYISDIYADAGTGVLGAVVNTAIFSPDGKTLILGGDFTGRAKIYSINGTNINYIRDIHMDNDGTALDNLVQTAVFSPDGRTFILGGDFTNKAISYYANGSDIFTLLYIANPVVNGKIIQTKKSIHIGFSKSNIEKGLSGKVKIIAEIQI